MKNLYKVSKEYSKKEKAILYILTTLIVSLLFYISFRQDKMRDTALSKGKKIKAIISKVYCTNAKSKSSLYFIDEKNVVRHVNVTYYQCNLYRPGDTITVFVNEQDDWYEIDPATVRQVDAQN